MREQNRLEHILNILSSYKKAAAENKGYLPLHIFLQNYFKQNKQMGSRDRRLASATLYNYFRLGKALPALADKEKIALGAFLCEREESPFINFLLTQLPFEAKELLNKPIQQKLQSIQEAYPDFLLSDILKFNQELSDDLGKDAFYQSFLIRPKVFLRSKKGFDKQVTQE
nr:hypothetical protein [Bacteroidota bacterium]